MTCEHEATRYVPEPWPTGEAIEVCEACGASRAHWEQGESSWIDMTTLRHVACAMTRTPVIEAALIHIELDRLELEKTLGDGYDVRIAGYFAARYLRELAESLTSSGQEARAHRAILMRRELLEFSAELERARAKSYLEKTKVCSRCGGSGMIGELSDDERRGCVTPCPKCSRGARHV